MTRKLKNSKNLKMILFSIKNRNPSFCKQAEMNRNYAATQYNKKRVEDENIELMRN